MRGFTDSEQILFTRVPDCPNGGSGACAFAHTCVEYVRGDDGVVRVDVTYVIAGHVDPFDEEQLYWSNTDGWVSYPDADVFSKDERMSLNLPIEGRWVMMV